MFFVLGLYFLFLLSLETELTPIISDMELTHLGLEPSIYNNLFISEMYITKKQYTNYTSTSKH